MESIVPPKVCGFLNKERLTPRELLMKNHKDMRKDEEQWMKGTTTSCTVVGALIVTIQWRRHLEGKVYLGTPCPEKKKKKIYI